MDERFQRIQPWLESLQRFEGQALSSCEPASADASFRRYFRVQTLADGQSYIIMDAPPEHEDCRPFIAVSKQLSGFGLKVPEVLEQDLEQGFLLLSDLGSTTLLRHLEGAEDAEVDARYRQSLSALAQLNQQGQAAKQSLPAYDATLLDNEMNLFSDWLIGTHLQTGLSPLQSSEWMQAKQLLRESALAQPTTYVHRDYHSRNIMVQASGIGVLDFQDAVQGALTYDAVSLLRDCYIAWPDEQVKEWQRFYFLQLVEKQLLAQSEWQGFQKSMDWMGVQRHLKAAGIFCRLYHRDGKDGYLPDIPQTLDYIVTVAAQYRELMPLAKMVESVVLPNWESA